MDNQKFEAILDSLLKHSEEGKLEWKSTGAKDSYLLPLKDSAISVRKDLFGHVVINFRNEKGEIVENITIESYETHYEKANKLYDLARRKALNTDETIDRILEQLNTDSIAA
jgi:hypothetical protein